MSIHSMDLPVNERLYMQEAVEKFKAARDVMVMRKDRIVNERAAHKIGDRIQASYGGYEIIVEKISSRIDDYSMANGVIQVTYQGPRVTSKGKPHASARGVAWQWIHFGNEAHPS